MQSRSEPCRDMGLPQRIQGPTSLDEASTQLKIALTIFTDAQAAMRRMESDDPGPGQKYALEARDPKVRFEIGWCQSHRVIVGNETEDEWAKLAADEPDRHGVKWLSTAEPDTESNGSQPPSQTAPSKSENSRSPGRSPTSG